MNNPKEEPSRFVGDPALLLQATIADQSHASAHMISESITWLAVGFMLLAAAILWRGRSA